MVTKLLALFALFLISECAHDAVPPPDTSQQGVTVDTLWTDTIDYTF